VVISPQDATRVTRGTPLGDAEAFRVTYGLARDPVVYILATSRTYRRAMACDRASLALFASVIVHEMAHGAGADERLATAAQRRFLDRVIHDPGTSLAARSILVQTRAQLDRR
jgi:hypothetical protein